MPYLGVKPADEFTSKDLNGEQLILDADADTTITADTDDQIDIRIAGADDFQFTANTFTVLSGSTLAVASGATIANSGTSTGFSASTLAAATTVGDGTAEDTKIVFDGNAQDYYIGLDDTDDDLKIGLGSAVGTTAHIVIDAAGQILTPLQPMFRLTNLSGILNVTGDGTSYDVVWANELFDIGGNCSGGVFTAPVAGHYLFSGSLMVQGVVSGHTTFQGDLVFSTNHDSRIVYKSNAITSGFNGYVQQPWSAFAYCAASETVTVNVTVSGGAKVVDVSSGTGGNAYFAGCLIG